MARTGARGSAGRLRCCRRIWRACSALSHCIRILGQPRRISLLSAQSALSLSCRASWRDMVCHSGIVTGGLCPCQGRRRVTAPGCLCHRAFRTSCIFLFHQPQPRHQRDQSVALADYRLACRTAGSADKRYRRIPACYPGRNDSLNGELQCPGRQCAPRRPATCRPAVRTGATDQALCSCAGRSGSDRGSRRRQAAR